MKNITGSEILPVIQKCQELKAHYRYSDNKLLASLMQWYICSFAGWSGAEIKCTIHLAMPKRPINQFEMNQQSRQLALRAFCPNIFTVIEGPATDFTNNRDTFFLMTSNFIAQEVLAGKKTKLTSPNFLGKYHQNECFSFWFYFGVRL